MPKILKLNSERDLFGLVDQGFNSYLYHWVNGIFYYKYDLQSFCDSLRSLFLQDEKEDTFVIWVACFKNNAKRPAMVIYKSPNKELTKCIINTEKLDFDAQDLHYVKLNSSNFLLYMSNLKYKSVLYGKVSLDPASCPNGI